MQITEASAALIGNTLGEEQIHAAAEAAYVRARPLDNTDFVMNWRKQMAREYTLRALRQLADTE
jgi:CO/xanthine dehydrogenase FAD-binding subunit